MNKSHKSQVFLSTAMKASNHCIESKFSYTLKSLPNSNVTKTPIMYKSVTEKAILVVGIQTDASFSDDFK